MRKFLLIRGVCSFLLRDQGFGLTRRRKRRRAIREEILTLEERLEE